MDQIELFENYLYLKGPYEKKKKKPNPKQILKYSNIINMNVQWMQFPNL